MTARSSLLRFIDSVKNWNEFFPSLLAWYMAMSAVFNNPSTVVLWSG